MSLAEDGDYMSTVTTSRIASLLLIVVLAVSMAGCTAVAGIFKAGMWVGIIIAVIVVAAAVALFSRFGS